MRPELSLGGREGGSRGTPRAGDKSPGPQRALSPASPLHIAHPAPNPRLFHGAERATRSPSLQHREVPAEKGTEAPRRSPQPAGPPWVRRDKRPPERQTAARRGRAAAARPLLTAPGRLLAHLKWWRGKLRPTSQPSQDPKVVLWGLNPAHAEPGT